MGTRQVSSGLNGNANNNTQSLCHFRSLLLQQLLTYIQQIILVPLRFEYNVFPTDSCIRDCLSSDEFGKICWIPKILTSSIDQSLSGFIIWWFYQKVLEIRKYDLAKLSRSLEGAFEEYLTSTSPILSCPLNPEALSNHRCTSVRT